MFLGPLKLNICPPKMYAELPGATYGAQIGAVAAQLRCLFEIYHQTYLKVETQVSASFSIYKQGPLLSLYSEFDRMRALIYTYVARANDLSSMANDSRDRNR